MNDLSDKLRWGEHHESPSLVQLQFKNCGMWYTLDDTTTHSLNDAGKYCVMQKYARSLFNIEIKEMKV